MKIITLPRYVYPPGVGGGWVKSEDTPSGCSEEKRKRKEDCFTCRAQVRPRRSSPAGLAEGIELERDAGYFC